MNARDAYLAYQAEIGTEEVILTQPWVKPRPVHTAVHHSGGDDYNRSYPDSFQPTPRSAERAPAFASAAAGADFFQSIAATLAKPEPFVKKGSSGSTAAPAPKPSVSPAPFLPDLQNLEAYWAFLEASCPVWFPGTSPNLVRAEGPSRPTLALVELFPTGNQVLGGAPGEFLDKMMKGIGLTRDHLYLTSVMKTAPVSASAGKSWARKDVARMLPALLRELQLAECGLVLLLGEACAQGVLRTGKSLAALAETAENHGNMTLVATEHPSHLMNADDATRRAAWNQLKWLRARLPSQGS